MRQNIVIGIIVSALIFFGAAGAFFVARQSANTPALTGRALEKWQEYHWYELTDAQYDGLTFALAQYKHKSPVIIVCGDQDCLPLAEDFQMVFQKAKWGDVKIMKPMDGGVGFLCSDKDVADIIQTATGIHGKIYQTPVKGSLVIGFGRKK